MRPLFEDMELEADKYRNTAEAARHVLERWTSHFEVKPREINCGDCELFAAAIKRSAASSAHLEITGCEIEGHEVFHNLWGGHVWLRDHDTGLHHDAERPAGTENWKALPLYRRRTREEGPPDETLSLYHRANWAKGDVAYFEYRCFESLSSSDSDLWARSHQTAGVLGEADWDKEIGGDMTQRERQEAGIPKLYAVRFKDGHEGTAHEDELLTAPCWTCSHPPERAREAEDVDHDPIGQAPDQPA